MSGNDQTEHFDSDPNNANFFGTSLTKEEEAAYDKWPKHD